MSPQVVRFEDFELDPSRYELRRAGQIQKLEKIPMELLLLLTENPGILITRQQIAAKLWGPDVYVESERGINTAVGKIRRVLNDDPNQPRYVQTVVGKGYRFIADIQGNGVLDPASSALPSEAIFAPISQEPGEAAATGSHPNWARTIWMTGLGLLAIIAAVFTLPPVRDWFSQLISPGIQSIAVLPMTNLANDPAEEYFVDGMTDQLITNLARATHLRVISRTSIMQFKNTKKPLPVIAHMLHVDAVIEGSVIRYRDELEIQAQLLDARRDRHLWAQTYTGKADQVLALQDEVTRDIAEHVASTLHATVSGLTPSRQVDSAAYEDYLRGRYYLAQRTPAALKKAAEYFEKAVTRDPNDALAYVGLADTYNVITFYGGPPPSETFPKAEAAAKRALALNDNLGEAHAALGDTLFSYHWDWNGAEREFRRAISLSPGDAAAHHWYSELLSMLGRHDEAIGEINTAKQLDPLSLVINTTVAGTLYLARRYDEARQQIKETLDLNPLYGPAHTTLGWIDLYQNKGSAAVNDFRRAMELSGDSPSLLAGLGCAYAIEGNKRKAREIAAKLEGLSNSEYVSPETLARLYIFTGEDTLALDRLEEAYIMHVNTLNNIYVEPCYDKLRNNPRFQTLLRRMHFVR